MDFSYEDSLSEKKIVVKFDAFSKIICLESLCLFNSWLSTLR